MNYWLQVHCIKIVIVLSVGHGGDGFLKFQDAEEITSIELADAFEQMWQKRRLVTVVFKLNRY